MALPLGIITPEPVYAPFLAPLQDWEYDPFQEMVIGGTAIGDGAAGREVQNWVISYASGVIEVSPENGAPQFSLAVEDVLTVSLGFDSNMAVAIAYQTAAGANFYYFSAILNAYTTLTVAGATSCRSSVDDPRLFDSGASDVIFAYVLDEVLYYRQQRDRYTIQYTVGPAAGQTLIKMSFTTLNRMQFELQALP